MAGLSALRPAVFTGENEISINSSIRVVKYPDKVKIAKHC